MQSGLAVLCSLLLAPIQSSPQAGPRWQTDYETARAAARAQDRPIFAVFVCMH
jgi:hypothetical protein